MAGQFTEPRDLRPHPEPDAPLRRMREEPPSENALPGRGEREAEKRSETGREDSVTKTSRVFFFVMAAIIAFAIAVFLILHPRPGG